VLSNHLAAAAAPITTVATTIAITVATTTAVILAVKPRNTTTRGRAKKVILPYLSYRTLFSLKLNQAGCITYNQKTP